MIFKVIHAKKAYQRRFSWLVPYVLKAENIAWAIYDNLPSLETATRGMQKLALKNRRVKKPAYHLAMSLSPHDMPTDEELETAIREALHRLGLERHQWVAARHIDAGHPHVHLVANRVHPETYRAALMSHDFWKLDKLARELETRYGWVSTDRYVGPGKMYRIGGLVMSERDLKPRRLDQGALRAFAREGRLSFQEWLLDDVRTEALTALSKPNASWGSVQAALSAFGVRYQIGERGAMLVDAFNPKFRAAASRLGRFAALPFLERQLGPYQARQTHFTKERSYSQTIANAKPASLRPLVLQKQYQAEADAFKREREALRIRLRQQPAVKRQRWAEIRAAEEALLNEVRALPKAERKSARLSVKRDAKQQIDRLKSLFEEERNQLRTMLHDLPRAETWHEFVHRLAANGNVAAAQYLENARATRHRRFEPPQIAVPLETPLTVPLERIPNAQILEKPVVAGFAVLSDPVNYPTQTTQLSLNELRAIARGEEVILRRLQGMVQTAGAPLEIEPPSGPPAAPHRKPTLPTLSQIRKQVRGPRLGL